MLPIIKIKTIILINKHTVSEQPCATRLSQYATGLFDQIPTLNSVKKAIKKGNLMVNGKPGATGIWIKNGDIIELYDSEQTPPKQYQMDLKVVFEDDYLAIIEKPAGISVSGNQFRTIANALIGNIKPSTKSNALKWPRPVHRLDNQTSGLLIISKTIDVHVLLGQMFEQKIINKVYHAIAMGQPTADGIIDSKIEEQSAKTVFQRVNTVPSLRSGYLTLLRLEPHTGRTHQLRIHLSQNGWPILGDKLYGNTGNILLKDGLYLCATSLHFTHPITNEILDISIPIPNKFVTRLKNEEQRWSNYNQQ